MILNSYNKNYIISILFAFVIFIYSLNILNENLSFFIFNNTFNILLKYSLIIFLGILSLFFFYKDKEYLKIYYYIIYIILFPYLLNGIVGIIVFAKGVVSLLISFLLYKCLSDKKVYKLLKQTSRIILTSVLFFYFAFILSTIDFSTSYSFKLLLNHKIGQIINHKKDLAILVIFLTFIIFYDKSENKKIDYNLILPSILIFFYLNSSKTLLILLLIFIFFTLFKNNRSKILISTIIFSIFTSIIFFNAIDKKNNYNILKNFIISVDQVTSLRISRLSNPCKWVEYRYFKSRTYYDMTSKDSGFKDCPYNKNDALSILPINFLNYNNEVNTDYFVDDKSFKKILVKLNNNIRSYNLDSFFGEYFYLNGIFFFFLLLIILINTFFAFYNYPKDKNNLFLLILIIIYFIFHSGMYAPGNLIAIVFNLLLYRMFEIAKNEKIFNNYMY